MPRWLFWKAYRQLNKNQKLIIFFLGTTILINEWLIFIVQSWRWTKIPTCLNTSNTSDCIRVVFSADPQIQGYLHEPAFLLGTITRWDADSYLRRTFYQVMHHVQPNVVIFLGDLLDEGSIANEEDYQSYIKRFQSIFPIPYNVKAMYLSGDNDIGGEGADKFKMINEKRFQFFMGHQAISIIKFMAFIKVNIISSDTRYQKVKYDGIRVLLSHLPISSAKFPYNIKVISIVKPHIIFSGHHHKSRLYKAKLESNFYKMRIVPDELPTLPSGEVDDKVWSRRGSFWNVQTFDVPDIWTSYLNDTDMINELLIPTCSYRMGVNEMGYGVAVFNRSQVWYTVLWLPSRYPQLYVYLLVLILVCILLLPKSVYNFFNEIRWYCHEIFC